MEKEEIQTAINLPGEEVDDGDDRATAKQIDLLTTLGVTGLSAEMSCDEASEIFDLNFKKRYVDIEYNPKLWEKYGYNPFSRIDGTS